VAGRKGGTGKNPLVKRGVAARKSINEKFTKKKRREKNGPRSRATAWLGGGDNRTQPTNGGGSRGKMIWQGGLDLYREKRSKVAVLRKGWGSRFIITWGRNLLEGKESHWEGQHFPKEGLFTV